MEINIPPSMTPRPGEGVVYYRGKLKYTGIFHGYDMHDQPMVKNDSGSTTPLPDFLSVRLSDPNQRQLGCYSEIPDCSVVAKATEEEKAKLDLLLNQYIEPGPKYIDLIEEIWARGYEVFLVGGSVRDVLNGDQANDVDLVTTIPFSFLSSIAKSMFGPLGYSRHEKNGFMSIGHNARSNRIEERGTLIDVKNFFLHAPGTDDVEFGADMDFDHRLRDFSCNAVYYDPINYIFVDPCGFGINDARSKTLNIINDPSLSHPIHRKAHIAMRMFKFMLRSYNPSEECIEKIKTIYEPMMRGCKPGEIWHLYYRTILSKVAKEKRVETFWRSKQIIMEAGFNDMWESYIGIKENEYGG